MVCTRLAAVALAVLSAVDASLALGTTCSTPLGGGTAASGSPYWLQSLAQRGTSPFNSGYQVRRNVKDFGAKGDGTTDDTAAINAAMSAGGRCGNPTGCSQSTLFPAVVYFPSGRYKISTPIISYWYTAMIGDGRNPPTLLAAANFSGIALIDADPYLGGDAQWYVNQNNFYRSLRNFVVDLTPLPVSSGVNGLHWQVSQATSISNLRIEMSRDASTNQVGMFMENGSGGYMGDITVNGGKTGLNLGNQQFTVRNVTVNNAQTAIFVNWSWVWLFYRIAINNCPVGFRLNTGSTTSAQTTGASIIADATFTNVGTAIQTTTNQPSTYASGFVLDNIVFSGVTNGVADQSNNVALSGGSKTVAQWLQGSVYTGTNSAFNYTRNTVAAVTKPSVLLEGGRFVSRPRPQYETYDVSQFVSVKALGAKGDGSTDDTAILKSIFSQYAGCKIIFFDAGIYKVSSTITIPAGTQVIGEAWSTIMGFGSAFSNSASPQVVVKVGDAGSTGRTEITDMLFTTQGPAAGAIVVEWNVHDPSGQQGVAGAWDTIIRIGGARGTNLQNAQCPKGSNNPSACSAAFLGLHLTRQSSAYLEGLWVWTADHDIDGDPQITVFSGRGILSESQGPVWLIGTGSEHNVLVQYNIANAANHFLGVIQTESPYYQPVPAPPAPFSINAAYQDPTSFSTPGNAWGLQVKNSSNILIYGAGLYSFFNNYVADTCVGPANCQNAIANIDTASSNVVILGLSTVGVTNMLNVNNAAVIAQSANRFGTQATAIKWTR
ncbi:glycoside hydrolase family 55 protein [Exidia glandulosa HHB12029]|uniref:Glycoside hydrolase family 55 protein n=1 Tax=Exidia glandulosa HHB12029 TaxID=1314781 RepID=A0A165FRX2_EXIGL|nr:glycoside hydrolase family 55 protein [Exidia glandulosa HHB12029]